MLIDVELADEVLLSDHRLPPRVFLIREKPEQNWQTSQRNAIQRYPYDTSLRTFSAREVSSPSRVPDSRHPLPPPCTHQGRLETPKIRWLFGWALDTDKLAERPETPLSLQNKEGRVTRS